MSDIAPQRTPGAHGPPLAPLAGGAGQRRRPAGGGHGTALLLLLSRWRRAGAADPVQPPPPRRRPSRSVASSATRAPPTRARAGMPPLETCMLCHEPDHHRTTRRSRDLREHYDRGPARRVGAGERPAGLRLLQPPAARARGVRLRPVPRRRGGNGPRRAARTTSTWASACSAIGTTSVSHDCLTLSPLRRMRRHAEASRSRTNSAARGLPGRPGPSGSSSGTLYGLLSRHPPGGAGVLQQHPLARLRPDAARSTSTRCIFGFVAPTLIGCALYYVPALLRTRLWSERLGWVSFAALERGRPERAAHASPSASPRAASTRSTSGSSTSASMLALLTLIFNLVMTVASAHGEHALRLGLVRRSARCSGRPASTRSATSCGTRPPARCRACWTRSSSGSTATTSSGLLLTPLAIGAAYFIIPRVTQHAALLAHAVAGRLLDAGRALHAHRRPPHPPGADPELAQDRSPSWTRSR